MTERSPARLLAPVALVAVVVALFVVVSSSTDESSSDRGSAATPTPAATQAAGGKRDRDDDAEPAAGSGEIYTVEPGDNPSIIAEKAGVDLDDLLAANPGLDARALSVGEELELP